MSAQPFYFNPIADTMAFTNHIAWEELMPMFHARLPQFEAASSMSIKDIRKIALVLPVVPFWDDYPLDEYFRIRELVGLSHDLRYLTILKPSLGAYVTGLIPRRATSARMMHRMILKEHSPYRKAFQLIQIFIDDYHYWAQDAWDEGKLESNHPAYDMFKSGGWVLPKLSYRTLEELQDCNLIGDNKASFRSQLILYGKVQRWCELEDIESEMNEEIKHTAEDAVEVEEAPDVN